MLALIALFTWGIAFCEPVLPALLTRYVPDEMRGTAAGVFNVHQFAGAFLGGIVGGLALSFGPRTMFVALAVALLGWTLISFYIPAPFRERVESHLASVLRRRSCGKPVVAQWPSAHWNWVCS